jgi:hypothetical protein
MKTRTIIVSFSCFFLLAGISIWGCKKDKTDKDQQAALDNSTAENAFNDVFNQIDKAAKQTTQSGAQKVMQLDSVGCATLTITPFDTFTFPKTLIIDFGTSNCLCIDGRFRRGKIISILSGKYRDSSTVISTTLNQYYVNDYHVEGNKTITNLGRSGTYGGTHNLMYSIVVTNGKVTSPTNQVITWNSTRTREWIEGENTHWPNWMDDVYLIGGSANGVDVHGNNFTVNISSSNRLRVALNCRWIESGSVDITPQGLATRTVDFGNGNCDNQATVTINGVSYPFTMY